MKNISGFDGNFRGISLPRQFFKNKLAAWLFVTLIALALQGCATSSFVKEIEPVGGSSPSVIDPPGVFVGELNREITFRVSGDGICKSMFIDFGDGTAQVEYTNVDLASKPTFTHTYTGWNGPKPVRAYGSLADGCGGHARARNRTVRLRPDVLSLGYANPVPSACMPYPNKPPLRKNTVVKISKLNPTVIDFGCFGGCFNDAIGVRDTAAGSGYPFPGLRERSLVIRVGTQVVQGDQFSSDFTFTTTEAGPLEICVNDYKLDDNSGAWGIGISIDESAAE